jgi:hypothetical protein
VGSIEAREPQELLLARRAGEPVDFLGNRWKTGSKPVTKRARSSPIRSSPIRSNDDFQLAPDSPAIELGFRPFDPSLAGVRGEAWRARRRGIHVENKGDSIIVTDETAASGKHSLKITDAPGLERS